MLQALCEVKDGFDFTHVTYLNHQLSKAINKVSKISTLRLIYISNFAKKPDRQVSGYNILLNVKQLFIDSVYSVT